MVKKPKSAANWSLVVVILAVAVIFGFLVYGTRQAAVDTAAFDKLAAQTTCAEKGIKLYLINDQYVFYSRRGGCPDNYYAYRLYGTTPEQKLCDQHDTIAGPRTNCDDESQRSLFETIIANQDKPDLGLGSSYRVQQIK